MLTNAQINQFNTEGYTTAPHFFDPVEVEAMQVEVSRWIESGMFRDVSTSPDLRQNFQLIPLYSRSDLFRALPFAPKVSRAIKSLIGGPAVKILDQAFHKPPHTGMGTSWHTDNAYFKLPDPLKGVAMWIAIHDGSTANGTLKVVPAAFNEEFPHTRDPTSDHHIHTSLDENRAVHCELEAGGVVFFGFGTPHATGNNQSNEARVGVGIHFVNQGCMTMPQQAHWQSMPLASYGNPNEFAEQVDAVLARAPS